MQIPSHGKWLAIPLLLLATAAEARHAPQFEVTITNMTRGQIFTPQLVATHSRSVSLFEPGGAASSGLEMLAEGGDTSTLTMELLEVPHGVAHIETLPDPLPPGESVTVVVDGNYFQSYLSIAAMLVPTNDTFVAVNGIRLPYRGSITHEALAYDAGTEPNDQNCNNMPGPRCGGEGFAPGPYVGEEGYVGYVHVSNGFHTLPPVDSGEVLGPQVYDWRNPVALIEVKRVR